MRLKSFNTLLSLLFYFLCLFSLNAEDKIDIWKNNENVPKDNLNKSLPEPKEKKNIIINNQKIIPKEKDISIEENIITEINQIRVYGIYDPSDFDFNINMWSTTNADDIKSSIKRLKKINLSNTSKEILENILLTFSYPPEGMTEKEFVNLKINWMIENDRADLIEKFLKQNEEFDSKSKAVQYLVDKNIAKANIKEGCQKIEFIDSTIKDSYLEKFKIYCLVFNNKKSEARLLLDLLREQKQSDKFFDDKINFLLGISDTSSQKINEKNLLNFYLSSVTITNFKYEPTKKTKKEIWKYLNASNLIKLEDVNDKEKLSNLELAANKGQLDSEVIFEIYQQIPFKLNTLVNAKDIYQTLNPSDARSLISEDIDRKIEYLLLLEDLFKKANLNNMYIKFLSDKIEEIGIENISKEYQEIAQKKVLSKDELELGKVKYNDKILHQSKILKFYLENEDPKKVQKDIDKIFKKISKNKKYFYSAKDLAFAETLKKDGFILPNNFNYEKLTEKYDVPKNLLQLIDKNQNAFLALKIVEIIGEDEPHQLDSETIYFITNLLNEMNLIQFRNKVLISALPLRV